MNGVNERAATAAGEVLEQHDPLGSGLRDNRLCRLMLAQAYLRGLAAGLEQAGDTARIRINGTLAEQGGTS